MSFFSSQEVYCSREWKDFCDKVAAKGQVGAFVSNRILRHLTVNAPVILLFVLSCIILHVLTGWFPGTGRVLGVHDSWNGESLLQYTSLFTHIFSHDGFGHLRGNMTLLLLVGPTVEHEFRSRNLLYIMLIVAVVSAVAHILIGKSYTHQLGASGVVFACILLNSLVSADNGKIPLAFLLTLILYLGEELALLVWNSDGVSHHAHLTGGLVGAAAGFYIHKQRRQSKTKSVVSKWLSSTSSSKAKKKKK